MELFADTADLEAVKEIAKYYPLDGITTNPKILTKAPRPLPEMMEQYREYVSGTELKIFFQVTALKAEDMLEQAKKLQGFFGKNLVVKLPAVREGYRAVTLCKAEGIAVTVTMVHSMMQALVAAKAGADYVAPYVSHIDNMGADGIGCVADMVTAFRSGGYPCKVLGASFRTVDQLKRLAVAGCQSVTITPEFFDALIAHPATDRAMDGFYTAWQAHFGDRQISDFLP